jgi:hypothetical protein
VLGDSDVAYLLNTNDFGVAVAFNGFTTSGILDYEDRETVDVAGQRLLQRFTTLLVNAKDLTTGAALAGLAFESTLQANGVAYRVRMIEAQNDGRLTKLLLSA